MAPLRFNVSGEAIITRTAERAVIGLGVSSSGVSREETHKAVIDTAQKIQVMLKELSAKDDSDEAKASAPLTRWSMGSLHAAPFVDYNTGKNKDKRKFSVTVEFNIRVRDFEKLGMLASNFLQTPHVKIKNVDWVLTEKTETSFKSELRRLASADALCRATDFAAPLGLDKISAVTLTETPQPQGYYGNTGARQNISGMKRMSAPRQYGGDVDEETSYENLAFEPDQVSMSAGVTCQFTAEASDSADMNKKRKLVIASDTMDDAEME